MNCNSGVDGRCKMHKMHKMLRDFDADDELAGEVESSDENSPAQSDGK